MKEGGCPMREYAIVTDSGCDIWSELAQSLDLTIVPLTVRLGEEEFLDREGEGIRGEAFYAQIKKGVPAQTSAPNIDTFLCTFRALLEEGKDILYLGFSSALSTTYHNASIAAEELREEYPEAKLLLVDTLAASLGLTMLLDLTVAEKRRGKSIEEVRDFAEDMKFHIGHWFTVDDLGQLRRGGRLSAGKALAGTLLHIKPIMHTSDEGTLVPMGTVKGRKNALEALIAKLKDTAIAPQTQTAYIVHSVCQKDADYVARRIQEVAGIPEVRIGLMGPLIGAHCGLGTLGLFFVGEAR